MKQHKWHKEIKAWADGAEVEFRYLHEGKWSEWEFKSVPIWTVGEEYQYRIKPQPKEPQYLYVFINNAGGLYLNNVSGTLLGERYIGKIKLEVDDEE